MAKGILSGLVWGGVTGCAVASVLSLYAPLQKAAEAKADTTTEPAKAEDAEALEPAVTTTPVEREPEESASTEIAPEAAPDVAIAVEPATEPVADATDVETPKAEEALQIAAHKPVTQPTAEAQQSPEIQERGPNVQAAAPDAVVDPLTLEQLPEIVAKADTSPSTGQATSLVQDEAEAPIVELETPDAPVRAANVADVPTAPNTSTAPTLASLAEILAPRGDAPGGPSLPQADDAPTASAETEPRFAALSDPKSQEPLQTTPVSADTPIKLPVPEIKNPVPGVVTNRLPSVTDENAETPQDVVVDDEETVEPETASVDVSKIDALTAYAATVEGAVTDALFSFILIDDGTTGMPRAEMIALDFPFSVAINPASPDAASMAAEYRAAGIEVLALLSDLPPTAEPSDVAVAMEGYFSVLNEAIAVMDPLDARIQSNRSLLQPVLGAIRDTGHGLVTYDRGLNTAQQAARREGIAAATVFRILDADGEEAPKIKRYLGRAAFNASKDGGVVVVGRSRPETVKAILEWALDEKGGELSIVPVSRVMQSSIE